MIDQKLLKEMYQTMVDHINKIDFDDFLAKVVEHDKNFPTEDSPFKDFMENELNLPVDTFFAMCKLYGVFEGEMLMGLGKPLQDRDISPEVMMNLMRGTLQKQFMRLIELENEIYDDEDGVMFFGLKFLTTALLSFGHSLDEITNYYHKSKIQFLGRDIEKTTIN